MDLVGFSEFFKDTYLLRASLVVVSADVVEHMVGPAFWYRGVDHKTGTPFDSLGLGVLHSSKWTRLLDRVYTRFIRWKLLGHGSSGTGDDWSLRHRIQAMLGEISRSPSPMPSLGLRWAPQALTLTIRWALSEHSTGGLPYTYLCIVYVSRQVNN